jgi:argininosuccinate lyase
MVHLSRLAEELILWSSSQFEFVDLPDAFCTGSSIMPQKKNPDVPELVRGKTGRVTGHLVAILVTMKAQPLAYNKDNQECQEALFDAHETVQAVLGVMTPLVAGLQPKPDAMRAAAQRGFSTATDLADELVRAGVAFRDAHEVVARAVRAAAAAGVQLHELGVHEVRGIVAAVVGAERALGIALSDGWLREALSLEGSVASRSHVGGTAPDCVRREVAAGRSRIAEAGAQP